MTAGMPGNDEQAVISSSVTAASGARSRWNDQAMDATGFWDVIEASRTAAASGGEPFHEALTRLLAARPAQEILDYQEKFDEAREALYRWDVWAAAYLVGGGCSDDSFIDFRAGLIAQGRAWYQKVSASPDSLAGHPAVAAAAAAHQDEALFYEEVSYAAPRAYVRASGDDRAFWDALSERRQEDRTPADMGENFDFEDRQEMRRRLPRLAALYYGEDSG